MRHFVIAPALWLAWWLACQTVAQAQKPIKLGMILDMSSVYADVTGPGRELAARMTVADFGGKVLGQPIEVMVADHQNQADIAAAIASK